MGKYANTRHQTSTDKTYTRTGWITKPFFSVGVHRKFHARALLEKNIPRDYQRVYMLA